MSNKGQMQALRERCSLAYAELAGAIFRIEDARKVHGLGSHEHKEAQRERDELRATWQVACAAFRAAEQSE